MELHLEERELSHEKQWEKMQDLHQRAERLRAGAEGRNPCTPQCRAGLSGKLQGGRSQLRSPSNTENLPREVAFWGRGRPLHTK